MSIRDAAPDSVSDATAIAEIYNESITVGDATMDGQLWTPDDVLRQQAAFGERECYLLLEHGGAVQGWGIIKRYSDRNGYRFACETAVYLRASALRQGFGSRLKLALIERCREWRYHHLVAKIFADNQGSIEYNARLGYEVVGRQREIGFKNGRWVDIVIMQLVLDGALPSGS